MDRSSLAFVYASLVYLVLGALLGLMMVLAPGWAGYFRYSHLHLLLGGFMAMMVFGVGYFILPRFAATALLWPSLVKVHFWMANFSLVGMVIARPVALNTGSALLTGLFHAAALVQFLSFLLFSLNVGGTLLFRPQRAATPQPTARPDAPAPAPAPAATAPSSLPVVGAPARREAELGPETPVATFVDRKQGALELLIEAGLRPLDNPGHLEMVRRAGIPLGHACSKHGIDLGPLLEKLHDLPDCPPAPGPPAGSRLTPDDVIGEVVKRHPATREIFRTRFGEGCFTCPGFETETLAQGAMMHGAEVDELIAELERTLTRDE